VAMPHVKHQDRKPDPVDVPGPQPAAPPPPPVSDESGVDLSLIRWFLTLRPLDRVRYASRSAASLSRLRVRPPAP
jgi:hypothetical protein